MMENPALTILIPNFNYARFLPETLDSILSQEFHDYEILIVDDCSTDHSHEVIKEYGKKDSRIRSIFLSKNLGSLKVFALGLKEARGMYFQSVGADDLYLPGYLSSLMGYLLAHPNTAFACSDLHYFQSDKPDEIEPISVLPKAQGMRYYDQDEVLELCRKKNFWIPGATSIAKVEFIHKHGGCHPDLANICDWYLFNRMALLEGVAYLSHSLFAMRKHQDSLTTRVKKNSSRRSKTYWSLLKILSQKQNREAKELFRQSTLLIFVVENLFWRLLFCPQYWCYFPPLAEKVPILQKVKRSLKKRLYLEKRA